VLTKSSCICIEQDTELIYLTMVILPSNSPSWWSTRSSLDHEVSC